MGELHIRVVTPTREVIDDVTTAVTAEGILGQFGVLPEHIRFLTELVPGWLTFRGRSGEQRFAVKGGYAEVRDDEVTILADEAIAATEIDHAKAATALDEATERLVDAPFGHPDHEAARLEVRWAELLTSASR